MFRASSDFWRSKNTLAALYGIGVAVLTYLAPHLPADLTKLLFALWGALQAMFLGDRLGKVKDAVERANGKEDR